MKAMHPSNYWALALHLQHCGHSIYLYEISPSAYTFKLSSGDQLYQPDGITPQTYPTAQAAKDAAAEHNIIAVQELEITSLPCAP